MQACSMQDIVKYHTGGYRGSEIHLGICFKDPSFQMELTEALFTLCGEDVCQLRVVHLIL